VGTDIPERIRAEIARRAGYCCEYCGVHEEDAGFAMQLDHVISRKHGGASTLENLAYCCRVCNRGKGPDVASFDHATGEVIRLFNPRHDLWREHFRLDGAEIKALTKVGEATVWTLGLNARKRLQERAGLIRMGRYPR
jgi:hypothetical protein